MSPENTKYLLDKHPEILGKLTWGFECGDGWLDLIDHLCYLIHWHLRHNAKPNTEQFVASQIKEKFGTLRFYGHGGDDKIHAMIEFAESFSGKICEQCGSPGKTKGHGWYYTACAAHTKEGDHEDSDQ